MVILASPNRFCRDYSTLRTEYSEQLYQSDDIAARICDLLPYEMLRQGLSVKVNEEEFKREGLSDILREALVKARIFGAAFIYIGIDDGLQQEHQIASQRIRSVRFLNVNSAVLGVVAAPIGTLMQSNGGRKRRCTVIAKREVIFLYYVSHSKSLMLMANSSKLMGKKRIVISRVRLRLNQSPSRPQKNFLYA